MAFIFEYLVNLDSYQIEHSMLAPFIHHYLGM